MMKLQQVVLAGMIGIALVACSSSPEVLNYKTGPKKLSQAKVGDEFALEHIALSYEDDADAMELCYSVDESGFGTEDEIMPEDFLTECSWPDLLIPVPENYDFEGNGFTRKDVGNDSLPSGWDRGADVTVKITDTSGTIPEAEITSLTDPTRDW
ncbi:hypothetical protein [Flaviflexus massiliensis]|uniref:hypothetical protein n=1 Tax=Flaviflexus massiliensis TaxID=1522309 RepID=UPI0006D56B93|nr:hypothetical protein [Flaviflexus massiliensis]